jgi:hypothetical protein
LDVHLLIDFVVMRLHVLRKFWHQHFVIEIQFRCLFSSCSSLKIIFRVIVGDIHRMRFLLGEKEALARVLGTLPVPIVLSLFALNLVVGQRGSNT